ncbi:MAG: GNAT family N-acetyltransferase, partial [Pseudomonadota bacterium]|nr:GNAT family N-acetyltransferase [Pseudomonadota bacterium]
SVYAAALQCERGRVDHLHPGLFEQPEDDLATAQQRAADHLWQQMPGPCRVLQVGVRTGRLLRRLSAAGYSATGTADEGGWAAGVEVDSTAPPARMAGPLSDLRPPELPYELMVLHDTAQTMAPLTLFEAADRLMVREGAQLLVMDEFALRSDAAGTGGLPSLTSFVALARRCGWRLEADHDLAATAAPTFDAIEALIQRHRQALCDEHGMAEVDLQRLIAAARQSRQEHAEGRWTYRLLRLRRPAAPALRLAAVGAAHSDAVRALFPARFGHELSQAEWNWKYGEGRGGAVGLFQGERLVAHYGGLTRRVRLMGEPALACQVGDVMVAPEVNGGLVRNSALHKVTATFLESQIGHGLPHAVGFGFPNARAMRLAQRLGLYTAVDEVHLLSWNACNAADERAVDEVQPIDAAALREETETWSQLNALWQTMAAAHATSALAVRDPAWLRYRYGQRPRTPYVLQLVRDRDNGNALGLVVLRVSSQTVELIDLVGDPRHYPRLVRQARRATYAHGGSRLDAWITASHAHELIDPADAPVVHTMDVAVPANAHTPGFDPARLRGRWFLMGGDTDFR